MEDMENSMNQENDINKQEVVSENQTDQLEEQPQNDTIAAEETGEKVLNSELEKTVEELAEVKDKYLRLYSEFENFRRRTSKEKLEMVQSANEQLIQSLLPVVDDFERAEKSASEATVKEFEGFILIQNKLKKILEQYGVKSMPLQPGADFDPDTQEAITQIPAPEESLKGKIVDVVEKGYLLNDKVIRYAKVVVGT